MSEDIKRAIDRQSRELAGPDPLEQQILLLKLTDLLESMPDLSVENQDPTAPPRRWVARAGALLSRAGPDYRSVFHRSKLLIGTYWKQSVQSIQGAMVEAIEELQLDLELAGRTDIGRAYPADKQYEFFTDLKGIFNRAESEIFLIDVYLDGEAFNDYLAGPAQRVGVRILTGNTRYGSGLETFVKKHQEQFNSAVEIRKSEAIHDRVVFVDRDECWIMGGSVKDAGKKPTYLIPVIPHHTAAKFAIYTDVWEKSSRSE